MNVEMVYSEDLIGLQVHDQVGSKVHQMAEENLFGAIRNPSIRPAPGGFSKPCCPETT